MQRAKQVLLFLLALPYGLTFFYLFIPPVSTLMLADWLTLNPVKREWVRLGRMSPNLVAAVISSEDDAFCDHFGFDFNQMEKSFDRAMDSRQRIRGASTITQQTAKNLFLWNGRSWLRKALEVPLTFWLELIMPKWRIAEIYLNIAEWGDGIYGAEAAAQHYFGVSARELSLHQAALLAAALPNPLRRNAGKPGDNQLQLAAAIEQRVAHRGPSLSCLK